MILTLKETSISHLPITDVQILRHQQFVVTIYERMMCMHLTLLHARLQWGSKQSTN